MANQDLDPGAVDALLRRAETLRSRRQMSRDLGGCREIVPLDDSDQEEASIESVHSISNGYKMPAIIDDDTNDDTSTPSRSARKRRRSDDDIAEIDGDEYSKSTSRKRRQITPSQLPPQPESPTPGPRTVARRGRSAWLTLEEAQIQNGVRRLS